MKKLLSTALAATLLAAISAAEEFTVTGVAAAGFNAQTIGPNNTLFGLTYSGSTFNGLTAGGFFGLGGNPTPGANFNNFGSLSLSASQAQYAGNTFRLQITFTAPTGIVGGSSTTFVANLLGQVTNTGGGGINIGFGTTASQVFTFANGNQTGTFDLNLNSVAVAPGHVASITGYIQGNAQPVPEPAALAGIGIGLVAMIRRKRTR